MADRLSRNPGLLDAVLEPGFFYPLPDKKLLWIADTLHLAEVECSAIYLDEARQRDDLEIVSELRDLPLDAAGNLPESM